MLRKYVGGLTLFVFTFTFTVCLFVKVNTLDAGPTQVFTQPWQTDFFCPDGTYATSSSGTHVNEYYHNHPVRYGGLLPDVPHSDHSTTYYYNSTLDYTTVTLSNNDNYCN